MSGGGGGGGGGGMGGARRRGEPEVGGRLPDGIRRAALTAWVARGDGIAGGDRQGPTNRAQ